MEVLCEHMAGFANLSREHFPHPQAVLHQQITKDLNEVEYITDNAPVSISLCAGLSFHCPAIFLMVTNSKATAADRCQFQHSFSALDSSILQRFNTLIGIKYNMPFFCF